MNEENLLIKQIGKDNPFKVPENYFTDFSRQMMENLPEREVVKKQRHTISIMHLLRPIVAAACLCGIVSGATIFFNDKGANENQATASSFQYTAESNINQMLEYAMLDNEDYYNYVFEE